MKVLLKFNHLKKHALNLVGMLRHPKGNVEQTMIRVEKSQTKRGKHSIYVEQGEQGESQLSPNKTWKLNY